MLPIDKLESLSARYREIEELLCQPNVVSDAKRYTGLSKERAELQSVVEAYGRYEQVVEDLAGHKDAMSDPDLRDQVHHYLGVGFGCEFTPAGH